MSKWATYVAIKGNKIHCRFPYNPKLIGVLKCAIPYEDRKPPEYGFHKPTASWIFPEEYLPDVEALTKSILDGLPYYEVDELPPYSGLDLEAM